MAVQHRLVRCRPERVWEVLRDGSKYAEWVVGTDDSWEGDDGWPREGAELCYRVRIGPWSYEGRTVVRAYDPPNRLELEAMVGHHASARIAIEVRPWGEDTLIILDEHPLRGRGYNAHHAVVDAFVHVRHRMMLARFARVVEADGDTGHRARRTGGHPARPAVQRPARAHREPGHPAR